MSCIFYYGAVLRCPPCHVNVRGPRCRVLQYVHDSLIVGGVRDRNTYPSKGVVAYGSKEDFILKAMVGFYLNDL
jgi:hypothetical protein